MNSATTNHIDAMPEIGRFSAMGAAYCGFTLIAFWTRADLTSGRIIAMPDAELVRKLLLEWDENTAATPEELCRPYGDQPDHGELLQAVREAMQVNRAVAPSTEISSDSWRTRPPTGEPLSTVDQAQSNPAIDSPPAGLRYRPVAQHRRGGLGEVLVADDTELHRKVALKRIRVDRCHDTSSQREFLREAEITARLEHPGIVPVHGLVHDSDGRPYYAMRFIEGESLHDAIRRFHDADKNPKRDPGERTLALRELLNRFVAVCNTIAYAHSRGVLHRDLKPQNIMLGKYGETLVVDWGLAKSFERSEEARATGEETVRPSALTEGNQDTQPGTAKGTPPYMSPEQASGWIDEIGPASDIFALGATLYSILTGTAPYKGSDALAKAKRREFPVPRQMKTSVPPPLEAICLKAMALKPEERYATAKALANDLEKLLADEPVTALPESQVVKLLRWAKRHRALVTTAIALLVATVVGLGLGLAAVERERERTAQERDDKDKALVAETSAREDEQQARERTLAALRDLTDDLAEDRIARGGYLTEENKEFLRKIIKHYEGLAAMTAGDNAGRDIRAEGYHRVGIMRHRLGELEGAATALSDALAIRKQLAADFPRRPEFQAALALSYETMGNVLYKAGKLPEAAMAYADALDIEKQLAADFPTRPEFREDLARTQNNRGGVLKDTGKFPEAATAYADALAIFEQLAADFSTRPEFRKNLAAGHYNLGAVLKDTGKLPEAATAYAEAVAILKQLTLDFPTRPEFRHELARSYGNLGLLLADTRKAPEAAAAYADALAILKQLAADFPTRPEFRHDLAVNHNSVGMLLNSTGKLPEAVAAYTDALAILKQLATDFPTRPEFRFDLAATHNNLGVLFAQTGKLPVAAAANSDALAIQKQLAADFPTQPEFRHDLAGSYGNLGSLYARTGKLPEAAAAFSEAVVIFKQLAADFPNRPKFRQDLAGSHSNLGMLYAQTGKLPEAAAAFSEAVAIFKQLAADSPTQPDYRRGLANTHDYLGRLFQKAGELQKAEVAFADALSIRKQLVVDFPIHAEFRLELAANHNNLGVFFAGLGKPAEVEAAFREALTILEKLAADFPGVPQYFIELGGSQGNIGNLLRSKKEPEAALEWYAKSITTLKGVDRHVNVDATAQRFMRNAYIGSAQAHDDLKRYAEAAADWDKAVELSPEPERPVLRLSRAGSRVQAGQVDAALKEAEELGKIPHPLVLYNAACVFALAASRSDESGGSLSKEKCAERAVALLQQAVTKGYKDADHMKKDPDLKALRDRDDFKKLLAELEAANAKQP
jgi:serine/threonine-protein kinase